MLFVLGCGYIGRYFLEQRGAFYRDCIASTTTESRVPSLLSLASEVVVLEGHDGRALEKVIDCVDVIAIFLAPGSYSEYEQVYLNTAKTLLPILQKRQRPLYLLYTSSTFVYEGCTDSLVSEKTPIATSHPKGRVLVSTENIYLSCNNPLVSTCILRLAGIYGPDRDLSDRARWMAGRVLPGSGLEPTNHVHRDDVVRASWFCIEKKLTGVFNVVSDAHPTRKELYEGLCQKLNIEIPVWDPNKQAEHGCGVFVCSDRIKEMGFVFSYPILITG